MKQRVYVFRWSLGDCSNQGVSFKHDQLMAVTADELPKLSHHAGETPVCVLEQHVPGCLRLVPLALKDRWVMFGGNYAGTSDSRFIEACAKLLGHQFYGAVAIHDRVEDQVRGD